MHRCPGGQIEHGLAWDLPAVRNDTGVTVEGLATTRQRGDIMVPEITVLTPVIGTE